MGIKSTASRLEWALREQVGTDQERMYRNNCVMWFIGTKENTG